MGKSLDWVREEPTGRLIFRRAYPEAIRPFLEKPGQRELKVPLGARRMMTIAAWGAYEAAKRQFDGDVERAKASQALHSKRAAGTFDRLTPDLSHFLVEAFKVDELEMDHEARWRSRPTVEKRQAMQVRRADCEELLREALDLRALGDLDEIVRLWGVAARDFASLHGFLVDDRTPEFADYVRLYHDGFIEAQQDMLRRMEGHAVPTLELPPLPRQERLRTPTAPVDQQTYQAIVEAQFERIRKPLSETTKEGVRTALKLFRETHGTPTPAEITRTMVSNWLDLLAQRPSKLQKVDRSLPLPLLVERYRDRPDVPRLSPKTIAQHLSMLAARWPEARRAEHIDREWANPFEDQGIERAKPRKGILGFTDEEARAIFSLPVFTQGERPRGGRGEAAYWLPLMLLFTGARP